jgi:hypothetical protein
VAIRNRNPLALGLLLRRLFMKFLHTLIALFVASMLGGCGYRVVQEGERVLRYESTQAQPQSAAPVRRAPQSTPDAIRPSSPQGTVEERWRSTESCEGFLGCAGRGSTYYYSHGGYPRGYYDDKERWELDQAQRVWRREQNRRLHERRGCNPCTPRHGWR